MAVTMLDPQPGERVLDPACGTGGFLITAMNHVLTKIEALHKGRWRKGKPTEAQLHEYYRQRHDYLSNSIFGLDLNPALVRAAKMNMVMNNDGSGNLAQSNSLEHPHRWSPDVAKMVPLGSIDVLVTNPPFGTKIVIDDPRILSQYDVAAAWTDKDENGKIGELRIRRLPDHKPMLQSSQAPEVLFVERALEFLKPGGRMAIVLRNGLLNNPGLAYFRKAILDRAQILAVVDMHRDLFQPHNDTQTSVVLMRKWAAGEDASSHGDYPIFMAIADTVGHNKRGKTIYKRNPDGTVILKEIEVIKYRYRGDGEREEVTVQSIDPIVDDETDEVAEKYLHWLADLSERRNTWSRGA
jgi:type I restriction enzyme M protein